MLSLHRYVCCPNRTRFLSPVSLFLSIIVCLCLSLCLPSPLCLTVSPFLSLPLPLSVFFSLSFTIPFCLSICFSKQEECVIFFLQRILCICFFLSRSLLFYSIRLYHDSSLSHLYIGTLIYRLLPTILGQWLDGTWLQQRDWKPDWSRNDQSQSRSANQHIKI